MKLEIYSKIYETQLIAILNICEYLNILNKLTS
jgi:hypothetical protein